MLTTHTECPPGVLLRHFITTGAVYSYMRIVKAGGCLAVLAQISCTSQVSWVQFLVTRAGTGYFRLVRPLRARKCEEARGVWGMLPQENFQN